MNDKIMKAAMDAPPVQAVPTKKKFDLDALEVEQERMKDLQTVELNKDYPLRRFKKNEFCRTAPGKENRRYFYTYTEQTENGREEFIVNENVGGPILSETTVKELRASVNQHGDWFINPVPVPDSERPNPWHESYRNAVDESEDNWIRTRSDMRKGRYRTYKAVEDLGDIPPMPCPFNEMLEVAFDGRVIDSQDHPAYRRLLGCKP